MQNKKSSEQKAYELIKNSIVNRQIAPGTQLVENTIAEKLGLSRTPIRNAYKRLSNEGLVNIISNKGAFVVQPTFEEMNMAYEMRLELEMLIVKYASAKAMENDFANLRELVAREELAALNKDIQNYVYINKEFHLQLARISGNKFLIEFTEKVIDKINIFLILYDDFYERESDNAKSVNEHKEMIRLIKEGNKELLEVTVKDHLRNSFRHLKENKLGYRSLADIF